jgi:alpha-tubulin suppressor-like RCC1 family protein
MLGFFGAADVSFDRAALHGPRRSTSSCAISWPGVTSANEERRSLGPLVVVYSSPVRASALAAACWSVALASEGVARADTKPPTPVIGLALSNDRSCALHEGGAVSCWGAEMHGAVKTRPVPVAGVRGATQVAADEGFACAIVAGSLRCWGRLFPVPGAKIERRCVPDIVGNQRCSFVFPASAAGVAVHGVGGLAQLTLSRTHACGRASTGSVRCWSFAASGANQPGTVSPTAVAGVARVSHVACASTSCMGVAESGAVYFWGFNHFGLSADGNRGEDDKPAAPVPGLSNVAEVALTMLQACARMRDQTVRCWGHLGHDGTRNVAQPVPTPVPGIDDARQVAVGEGFVCVLRRSGIVACWGQPPDSALRFQHLPTPVAGITDAVEIAASGYHVCVRRAGGQIACWGTNDRGQLGDGTTVSRKIPAAVAWAK